MIDSADRNSLYPSAWDFSINKQQPYVSGFFSRAGATEVVMEWCEDNINTTIGVLPTDTNAGNTIGLRDLSGVQTVVTLNPGKYTVAQALDALCAQLNLSDLSGGRFFSVSTTKVPGQVVIDISGTGISAAGANAFPLWRRLDIGFLTPNTLIVICPDLRPYRYVDIVSDNLTSVQDARDASTQALDRNVLVRWYFSFDEQNLQDAYGFPILMGYTRFCLRRLYNPPKQIKWEQNLPISNLQFNVYDPDGNLLPASDINTNWLMTIQLSEG